MTEQVVPNPEIVTWKEEVCLSCILAVPENNMQIWKFGFTWFNPFSLII